MTDFVVGEVRLANATDEARVQEVITTLSLEAAIDQVTQLTIGLQDDGLALRRAGLASRGVLVDWADLDLVVGDVHVEAGPAGQVATLELHARPAVVRALKLRTGAKTWTGMSATEWLAQEVADVGGTLIAKPSAVGENITRAEEDGQDPQSSWDVATTKASELGYWLFHTGAGQLVFAPPSWLVEQAVAGGTITTISMSDVAGWSTDESDDSPKAPAVVILTLTRADAAARRIGQVIDVADSAGVDGRYVITRVTLDAGQDTGTVEATAPDDPAPRPPAASGGGGGFGIRLPAVIPTSVQPPTFSGGPTVTAFLQALADTSGTAAYRIHIALARLGVSFPATAGGQAGAAAGYNGVAIAGSITGDLVWHVGGPNGVDSIGVIVARDTVLTDGGTTAYKPAQWTRAGRIKKLIR